MHTSVQINALNSYNYLRYLRAYLTAHPIYSSLKKYSY